MNDGDWLPDVHFGEIGKPLPKVVPQADDENLDDDEQLAETPADVIAILGFDPLDEIEDGEDIEDDATA